MRDVIVCPGCRRRLQLPDEALGQRVQCPSCQREFTAEAGMANLPATAPQGQPAGTPASAQPPPTHRYDELDKLDRPRRRRRREEDEDDDGYGRRPSSHRGGEILTFGLLGLLPCPLTSVIFGMIAWMMANADLAEMRVGRMDRAGEGLSQAGRALGITGLFLWTGVFGCLCLAGWRDGF